MCTTYMGNKEFNVWKRFSRDQVLFVGDLQAWITGGEVMIILKLKTCTLTSDTLIMQF